MSEPEQKGEGKPLGDVPRGIELLIQKAAVDPQFRQLLLENRAEAAKTIGLELRPSEIAMLNGIPQAQLEAIISRTKVDPKLRPILIGATKVVLVLAALGAGAFVCEGLTLGISPDYPWRKVKAPAGSPATTRSNPAVTPGGAPIMTVDGGIRTDRPPASPAGTTTGSTATTNIEATPGDGGAKR